MSTWTEEELRAVGTATELRISTRRRDGTLLPPVPIWVVRAGDNLYVRSYKGTGGAWFRRVTALGTAHIHAADVDRDVTVSLTGTAARAEIDEAYRAKYARYGRAYVEPMTADTAAATTLLLTPVTPEGR
jgi:hypothetical protein